MINEITDQYPLLKSLDRKSENHWTVHWDVPDVRIQLTYVLTKSIDMLNKNTPGVKKRGQV